MSAVLASLRRAHRRLAATPDQGTTMVEIVVAMIIMTICGAIFTGAVVTLFRANNAAQAVTNSSQQINQAYQALDKIVRYASAVSKPGVSTTSGNWYVELSDTTSGTEVCTQLRLDKTTKTLQQRSWNVNANGTASPASPDWRAMASGLTNGAAASGSPDQPFLRPEVAGSANHQKLTFTLVASAGTTSDPKTSRSSFTLSALNSVPQPTGSICQQVTRP